MASQYDFDLDPVSFITIGTQGPPGRRTFFLQAAQGPQIVSLVIEKQQAVALAEGLQQMLERIEEEAEGNPWDPADLEPVGGDMALLSPVRPSFRVAQMGIGVDEDEQRIVLIAEAFDEEDEDEDEEPMDATPRGQRARFSATFGQMAALGQQALEVAGQGRPICPLCGEPMDPKGHFCPRTNGHQHGPSS
jgi:uncharacterized repeat protein (TIGR03847 family)